MTNFEERWWEYFVPECYFDTVLIKKLLQCDKKLFHRKGCNNVIIDLKSERLRNFFAVAIVDKDKWEPEYLKECDVHFDANKLRLLKHKHKHHYIIQLNPPLEKWVIEVLDENQLRIEDFGYPRNYRKLKAKIKNDITSENDERLKRLINAIIKTDCESVRTLKRFLHYLKTQNIKADINELING